MVSSPISWPRCLHANGQAEHRVSLAFAANKVGRPAARQVAAKANETLCSDCPLACKHLGQLLGDDKAAPQHPAEAHPIEVFARAYGVI